MMIYIKVDLALNNLQRLISNKPNQPTKQDTTLPSELRLKDALTASLQRDKPPPTLTSVLNITLNNLMIGFSDAGA